MEPEILVRPANQAGCDDLQAVLRSAYVGLVRVSPSPATAERAHRRPTP